MTEAPILVEEEYKEPEIFAESTELLKGAIDLHIHTAPDIYPRSVNAYECAIQARKAGMRAVLLKSHYESTAARAELVRDVTGFPAYGALTLSYGVGGFNWHAVREAHWQGARKLWMPTIHAKKFFALGSSVPTLFEKIPADRETGLYLLDGDGELRKDVKEIVNYVAEAGMILATGHVGPEEAFPLMEYARDAGVENLVLTHPNADFLGYTTEQMQQAAALGANIEMNYAFVTKAVSRPVPMQHLADIVKAVGPERCFLATDGGQRVNPVPVEAFRRFIAGFLTCGFTRDEIKAMTSELPARLLGLDDV